MYVCICNAVSEGDVHRCVSAGADTLKQVKNACGWKPGCGSCTARLAEAIGRSRVSASAESTAA
ncbi:(2Fe-2S)-binding protein [Nocardia sp. CA-107356]|uniref:(2Fe-2S)-binding protein n=1 Tax=Nocardia sp. CA-107356 TaxID=3239972 RepID=UPI003D92492A